MDARERTVSLLSLRWTSLSSRLKLLLLTRDSNSNEQRDGITSWTLVSLDLNLPTIFHYQVGRGFLLSRDSKAGLTPRSNMILIDFPFRE